AAGARPPAARAGRAPARGGVRSRESRALEARDRGACRRAQADSDLMSRPRLLLVPLLTELEWDPIRPQLEEWAEVASFDVPGVGEEPAAPTLDRETMVQRGLVELERRGWDRCVVAADGMGG